jgi:DNA invertase Pin-like site-specific DNA recombinase
MRIGYARVSTHDQSLNLQLDALKKAGCSKFFTDVVSGAKAERKGLEEALSHLREGDTLVVWKLDRLGRSLPHLIQTVNTLKERKIDFKSLTDLNIDTTTPGGKLVFHVFGAVAEFFLDNLRERTRAGLEAARVRGRTGGRPKALTQRQIRIAQSLYDDPKNSIQEICRTLKVSKVTLYRYIKIGGRDRLAA